MAFFNKTYICECGCGIRFFAIRDGLDIRIINKDSTEQIDNKIILETALFSGQKWTEIIPFNYDNNTIWHSSNSFPITTFGQFIEFIMANIDKHPIYQHLYNGYYSLYDSHKDCELSYEYIN